MFWKKKNISLYFEKEHRHVHRNIQQASCKNNLKLGEPKL